MTGSTIVEFGEVLKLALDPHPVEASRNYPNVGIYSFGRGLFRKPDIAGMTTSATTLYRIRSGQLIYSKLFAFEGAYALVTPEFNGSFVSNEFPTFEIDTERASPIYMQWLFRNPQTWRGLSASSTGMGDRRQRIHPERILEYTIRLPPRAEQRRLAVRLDQFAREIDRRRAAAEAADAELARTIRAAFERVIAGAPRVRMGDVAPLVRRPAPIQAEEVYTEIGVRSFYKGTFHRRRIQGSDFTWQELFLICEGDLIFSNLMAWEQAIAVARPCDAGCVGNHRILTCEADGTRVTPGFLHYHFQTPEGFSQVLDASPGSTARNKTLSAQQLPKLAVPQPSLDAQEWFDALQQRDSHIRKIQAANNRDLDAVIPAMLDRLFDGA